MSARVFKDEKEFLNKFEEYINYCDENIPHTRVHEHKHFTPWEQHDKTVYFQEFSKETTENDIPYYPKRLKLYNEIKLSTWTTNKLNPANPPASCQVNVAGVGVEIPVAPTGIEINECPCSKSKPNLRLRVPSLLSSKFSSSKEALGGKFNGLASEISPLTKLLTSTFIACFGMPYFLSIYQHRS